MQRQLPQHHPFRFHNTLLPRLDSREDSARQRIPVFVQLQRLFDEYRRPPLLDVLLQLSARLLRQAGDAWNQNDLVSHSTFRQLPLKDDVVRQGQSLRRKGVVVIEIVGTPSCRAGQSSGGLRIQYRDLGGNPAIPRREQVRREQNLLLRLTDSPQLLWLHAIGIQEQEGELFCQLLSAILLFPERIPGTTIPFEDERRVQPARILRDEVATHACRAMSQVCLPVKHWFPAFRHRQVFPRVDGRSPSRASTYGIQLAVDFILVDIGQVGTQRLHANQNLGTRIRLADDLDPATYRLLKTPLHELDPFHCQRGILHLVLELPDGLKGGVIRAPGCTQPLDGLVSRLQLFHEEGTACGTQVVEIRLVEQFVDERFCAQRQRIFHSMAPHLLVQLHPLGMIGIVVHPVMTGGRWLRERLLARRLPLHVLQLSVMPARRREVHVQRQTAVNHDAQEILPQLADAARLPGAVLFNPGVAGEHPRHIEPHPLVRLVTMGLFVQPQQGFGVPVRL